MALPAAAALAILLSLQVHSAAEKISYGVKKFEVFDVFPIEHSYNSSEEQTCRWRIVSQPGYYSRLECSAINLPSSPGCSMDQLNISSTDVRIGDHVYCDRGKDRLVVMGPRIDMVLKASPATPGGNFSCNVTTMLNNCSCGYKYPQPQPTSRIVDGDNTGVNEFPMMVLLKRFHNGTVMHTCGGTIISQRFVLTAAHCVVWAGITEIQVYVGEHDVNATDESPATQRVDVAEIIEYGRNDFKYIPDDVDIALLRLASDIQFSERVGPACLPFKYTEQDYSGSVLTLLAWGRYNITQPSILRKGDVQVVSLEFCRRAFPSMKPEKNFCTYTLNNGPCLVDSGGPVLYTEPGTGRQFIVGVILTGCDRLDYPRDRIHVKVAEMLRWIVAKTPGVQHCAK